MRNLLAIGYYMFVSVISKSIDETDPMKILIHFQWISFNNVCSCATVKPCLLFKKPMPQSSEVLIKAQWEEMNSLKPKTLEESFCFYPRDLSLN